MRTGIRFGIDVGLGAVCLAISFGCTGPREFVRVQESVLAVEPSAQALWPDTALPVPEGVPEESVANRSVEQNALGLNRSISHVSAPTLSIHMPEPRPVTAAAAVVVCPGGAFRRVVIDKEGHDIARWLNSHGIVGVVLKYRTGPMGDAACLEDAQRAIRTLRANAAELGLDPRRIGIMGFSAGGHLALRAVLHPEAGNPEASDPVQRASSRPDFACMIYPAVPADMEERVNGASPPVFFVHSYDDGVPIEDSVRCFQAWKKAGVKAEAHFYATGGHAYGLGVRGGPVASWPDRFIDWLASLNR